MTTSIQADRAALRAVDPHAAPTAERAQNDEMEAFRCGYRQGYIAATGALELLLRAMGWTPEIAFERATAFAEGALATWQERAGMSALPPPQLVPAERIGTA